MADVLSWNGNVAMRDRGASAVCRLFDDRRHQTERHKATDFATAFSNEHRLVCRRSAAFSEFRAAQSGAKDRRRRMPLDVLVPDVPCNAGETLLPALFRLDALGNAKVANPFSHALVQIITKSPQLIENQSRDVARRGLASWPCIRAEYRAPGKMIRPHAQKRRRADRFR